MRRWREEDREPVITTLYKVSLLPSYDRRRSGHHIRFTVLSSISLRGSRAGHSCKVPSIFDFFFSRGFPRYFSRAGVRMRKLAYSWWFVAFDLDTVP